MGDLVILEVDNDAVLGALEPVLIVTLDNHGIETAVAVCVATGCQKSRHVLATVLVVAEGAVQVTIH